MFFDFRCLSMLILCCIFATIWSTCYVHVNLLLRSSLRNFTSLLTLMSSDPKLSLRFVFSICLVKMMYMFFPALRSIFHLSHHFSKCLIPICEFLVAIYCFSCAFHVCSILRFHLHIVKLMYLYILVCLHTY